MADILVIEDEPQIRFNLQLMLSGEGHHVRTAANGAMGLEELRRQRPDLVLCDVMMPVLDGFGVLEKVRADPKTSDLPFLFLTALDDRASMRRGMNLGADDYINKPFTRDELIESVTARLKQHERAANAVSSRLVSEPEALRQRFLERTDPVSVAEQQQAVTASSGKMVFATVLFSDIREFTTISERLTSAATAEFLNAYFERACVPVLQNGGRIAKLIGDAMMVVFEPQSANDNHALRAVKAALGIAVAAYRFRDWMSEHHGNLALPEFAIGVGIHSGEMIECLIGPAGSETWTTIGDSVNVASRLESQTKKLGWPIIVSRATLDAAGATVRTAHSTLLELRGREGKIQVFEVTGVATADDAANESIDVPAEIRAALNANARNAAQVSKAVLSETILGVTSNMSAARDAALIQSVAGYRVISKIGQGGMSQVYLAERESDGEKLVLKILNARPGDDPKLFQRFVQEVALISNAQHNNVVRIYDHGVTEKYAFLAMEYLPNGTLADVIAKGLTPRQALSILAQLAGGLSVMHARGIIHRDLKPANIMVREDGTMAIADFGIAKKLDAAAAGQTRHGELIGTPYYIAPELVENKPASERSDIYSLGIIYYEMLTGQKPFDSTGIAELIGQHLKAPIPRLPDKLAEYQPLVDGMMAKNPDQRFQTADAVLDAVDRVWTQISLRSMN